LERDRGNYARSAALYAESLALFRRLGDQRHIGGLLYNLGFVMRDQGNFERAQALCTESLALYRESGDKWGIANAVGSLARIALDFGNYDRARSLAVEGVEMYQAVGNTLGVIECIESLSQAAQGQGEIGKAVQCLALAATMREKIHAPVAPVDRDWHDRALAAAHATIGDEAFAVAWEAGAALTLDDAIAEATNGGARSV